MLEGDEILFECNESELLWMARLQGLPILRRGIPKEELVEIIAGKEPKPEHLAWTNETRARLEKFIQDHYAQVMNNLPGCNGQCKSFLCTEEKHLSCFVPNQAKLI